MKLFPGEVLCEASAHFAFPNQLNQHPLPIFGFSARFFQALSEAEGHLRASIVNDLSRSQNLQSGEFAPARLIAPHARRLLAGSQQFPKVN